MHIVMALIIFIASIYLLVTDTLKQWPEIGIGVSIIYGFCGFTTYKYLKNPHQSFGDMADLIIYILGGCLIILSGILALLLIMKSLNKYTVSTRLCGLLGVILVGHLLADFYQKQQIQKAEAESGEYVDPVNQDIEAKNRALEEGIEPGHRGYGR